MDPHPDSFLPLTPMAFEILVALGDGDRHGYDIMTAIERRTSGAVSPNPGTLYRAIDRLVREGLLRATDRLLNDADSRRFFQLTSLGKRVAAAEVARLVDQVKAARGTRLLKKATGG
jgi:DNA-binding PadR family transcriptional regulator